MKQQKKISMQSWMRSLSITFFVLGFSALVGRVTGSIASQANDSKSLNHDNEVIINNDIDNDDDGDTCTLYLAPSTIQGANLGVFTAKNMKPDEPFRGGDVSLPFIDLIAHMGGRSYFSHFKHFTWTAEALGMHREGLKGDGFSPGLYCATNSWIPLINIDGEKQKMDGGGLHRSKDPGAGAITPYHNATVWALKTIPAGAELYIDYGDSWFQYRENAFGLIPLTNDYPMAEILIQKFASVTKDLHPTTRNSIWALVKSMPYPSRLYNAFPETLEEADVVAKDGMVGLHQPRHMHTLKYLHHHGACLDNMKPGESSIPQAGRGAFATRPLAQGQIITTAPLVHVPFRDRLMTMYGKIWSWEGNTWTWNRDVSHIAGEQVIVNYCFGHVESSLLLCPYSSGVGYINHFHQNPNVKIQWAKDGRIAHQDDYLDFEISDFIDNHKVGLAIEFVALRPIAPGEELLIDYGDRWEKAWNEHVASWKPNEESSIYEHSGKWNEIFKESPIRTVREQEIDPYPSHLLIHCHASLTRHDWRSHVEDKENHLWELGERGVPCTILKRHDQVTMYDVELYPDEGDSTVLYDVPRMALAFADEIYSTDLHLSNVFRHPMQLPDDMMPDQWRNL